MSLNLAQIKLLFQSLSFLAANSYMLPGLKSIVLANLKAWEVYLGVISVLKSV